VTLSANVPRGHNRKNRPAGFTLIEILVVIFIISILASLLLPGLQAARMAAQRLECSSHIRQMMMALNNYASTYGYFPAINSRTSLSMRNGYGSAQSYSPIVRLLPELEQLPLYNGFNFSGIPTTGDLLAMNATCMRTGLNVTICPSDLIPVVAGFGRTNYRFSTGPSPWYSPSPILPQSLDGAFTVHYFRSPADFQDGLSNTAGVSERLQGDWVRSSFKYNGDYWLIPRDSASPPRTIDEAIAFCSRGPSAGVHESRSGESWAISGFHFTNYNHCLTPNSEHSDCAFDNVTENFHNRTLHNGVFSATSFHLNGVNVGFMDGSVRFVTKHVTPVVWRAIATRNGSEIVGAY